jgi:DNA-binding PadR family transcriptional regulator
LKASYIQCAKLVREVGVGQDVMGGFEHQVLLAVFHLGDRGAYTVPVVDALSEMTGRAPSPAAVFTTLRRLERRGLLRSSSQPSPVGGRPRRVFHAEPAATEVLRRSRATLEALWKGLPIFEGPAE